MVTTLYAGILGLLYIALSFYVIKARFKYGVDLGDDGNKDMMKRIRIHANFIEYVPFALLLIFLAELEGLSELMIHILGGGLVVARIMHATGIARVTGISIGRSGGMIITFLVIVIAAIFCVKSFFFY